MYGLMGSQVGEEGGSQLPSLHLIPAKVGKAGSAPLLGVALSPFGWSMGMPTYSISPCCPQGP